jgi:hypothetical protein
MNNIIEYLKKNWQKVSLVTGLALIVLSAASFLAIASMHNKNIAKAPGSSSDANTPASSAAVRTYVDLYAVSIDNHVDARPASGINKAAFVYETPVEGNITRFLAFFERGIKVAQIGPVRSARMYLLDWITQYGVSYFFHYGGSPEAMAKIASTTWLKQVDKDGTGSGGSLFWRDEKGTAPHNAYTSSDNAAKLFDARLGAAQKVGAWLMENDPEIAARGTNGQKVSVQISTTASYIPVWIYNSSTNLYERTVNDKVEKDSDGTVITAKNIIVVSTDISVIDAVGRLKVTTSDEGLAIIYRNGKSENATWKITDPAAPPRFYRVDGTEAVFTNGNVWVEVVKK